MRGLKAPLGLLLLGLALALAVSAGTWLPILWHVAQGGGRSERTKAAREGADPCAEDPQALTPEERQALALKEAKRAEESRKLEELQARADAERDKGAKSPDTGKPPPSDKPGAGKTTDKPADKAAEAAKPPTPEQPVPPPPPEPIPTVEGQEINPNLDGYFTESSMKRVRGFAFDKAEREAEVWVTLLCDEAEVAQVRCDKREDNKQHGVIWIFQIDNPDFLADGQQHRLRAYAFRKGVHGRKELRWSPRDAQKNRFPQGRIEAAAAEGGITGYAWDPDEPKKAVSVMLVIDGEKQADAVANLENKVLAERKITPGPNCAFKFDWPEKFNDGQEHIIQVFATDRQADTEVEIDGSPRTVAPVRGTVGQPPIGRLEIVNKSVISGWTWDADAGTGSIDVEIWIDGEKTLRIPANSQRDALVWAKITPDANHGFVVATPGVLLDDKTHIVRAYAVDWPKGLLVELDGSPITYKMETNTAPMGGFWHADETRLQGWAADPELGTAPCEIEIYIDGKLWQRVKADKHDGGLVGTGYAPNPEHGFRVTPPESVKDGQPHEIQIYAINYPDGPPTNLGTRTIGKNSVFAGFWTQDKLLDTRIDKGLYVSGVSPWFDAYHKDVKIADVLVEYEGQAATTTKAFTDWLQTKKKDDKVKVKFWRDGQHYGAEIKLGQLYGA